MYGWSFQSRSILEQGAYEEIILLNSDPKEEWYFLHLSGSLYRAQAARVAEPSSIA